MSVIIRLQNLPWSANALDIRNYFRGLSIPEGGVHIVGGELGDAFIAFSTDEDARQAMMLDCGKIKEIQVKLLLSSRSEMHKVIETARQTVPIMSLTAPAPAPAPVTAPTVLPPAPTPPVITPFSAALGANPMSNFGIPGIGNPQEIPQPAVIEPPAPLISPTRSQSPDEEKEKDREDGKPEKKRKDDRRRSRSRSKSRDKDRKDRKRDRRDRSRSRERRRRDRSRSRDRRDRKRDRKDRSRSRDRSPTRRSRDRRNIDRKSPTQSSQERNIDGVSDASRSPSHYVAMAANIQAQLAALPNPIIQNGPLPAANVPNRFNDPTMAEAFCKLQELGKKRNPNAFQGEQQNSNKFQGGRGGGNVARGGGNFRREGRRFDNADQYKDCCVVIKNAPNHTSYGDVRRFFPYMIDKHGIKMINDNMGRRTGTIYVRFCDPQSKQMALQRKSNELKGASVIVDSLDHNLYESAVDSFLPYREDNDTEDDTAHAKIDLETNNTMPYSVLKLSDLPNYVKEHDIIKMFSDFSLLSIILEDCRMTRSKIAHVQFVKPEDARLAFDRKENYAFGRRQVTLTPLSNEEFESIKPKTDNNDVPPLDLMQANQEMSMPRDPRQRRQPLDNGSVAQTPLIPGQPQGPGFFPNPSFPQNLGAPFPGPAPQFGGYPTPGAIDPRTAAANWASRPQFPDQPTVPFPNKPAPANNQRAVTVNMEEEPLDSVLMKGLPRDATDRTIVNFLSDTGAVPARIHLMLDVSGIPSGDCFCEFRSPQEARQAATKHGQMLDGCRVTVDLVPRSVVEEALEGPKEVKNVTGLLGNAPPFFEVPRVGFGNHSQPFRGRGSYDRGVFERGGFRGGFDQVRGGFDKGRGSFDQGRSGFDQGRGSYRGRGGWNERARGFERGRGRGFGRGRGGFTNGDQRAAIVINDQEEQDSALEDFGAPGCVVSMENVPFRASVDDILAFFGEFELTQDDVIRRYNERGQPTGDARVAFRTPFDAQRAIKTRQMNTIFDRRINLTIL